MEGELRTKIRAEIRAEIRKLSRRRPRRYYRDRAVAQVGVTYAARLGLGPSTRVVSRNSIVAQSLARDWPASPCGDGRLPTGRQGKGAPQRQGAEAADLGAETRTCELLQVRAGTRIGKLPSTWAGRAEPFQTPGVLLRPAPRQNRLYPAEAHMPAHPDLARPGRPRGLDSWRLGHRARRRGADRPQWRTTRASQLRAVPHPSLPHAFGGDCPARPPCWPAGAVDRGG